MSPPKGYKPPAREVQCVICRTPLLRRTCMTKAKCAVCQEKHRLALNYGEKDRVRTAARRYRIIMHALGWEDSEFEEALAEMRRSPMSFRERPENRFAKADLTIEHRRAGWKRRLLRAYADGVEMVLLMERFGRTPEAIEKMAEREGIPRPPSVGSRLRSGRAA